MKHQPKRTHVTAAEVFDAFQRNAVAAFNRELPREALLCLTAQWAFETGTGDNCYNFNLGNEKSHRTSGDWYFIRCNEIINGKTVWFEPDHPACCFRSYSSLDEGALGHLGLIRRKYGEALAFALEGRVPEFVAALRAQGYFTASLGIYTRNVVSIYKKLDATLGRPTVATLEVGSPKQALVEVLNEFLAAACYLPETLEQWDVFGPATRDAIREFQAATGLVSDGIVGPVTWRRIFVARPELETVVAALSAE